MDAPVPVGTVEEEEHRGGGACARDVPAQPAVVGGGGLLREEPPGMILEVGGKRVKLPGEAAAVARQPRGKIEAHGRDDEIAGARRGLERGKGRFRRTGRARCGRDQEARDRADACRRAGREAQRAGPVPAASDDPDPDRDDRHLASPRERDGTPEGDEEDAGEGQQNGGQADAPRRVHRPDGEEASEERHACRAGEPEEWRRQGRAKRAGDARASAESREERERGGPRRFAHPGHRRRRLCQEDGRRRQGQEEPGRECQGAALTPLAKRGEEERSEKEERQVMRPEADRGGRGDTDESAPARGVPDDEEKEEEAEERELCIGPRLRRVEKEERSGGREPEKTPAGSTLRKRTGAGAERRESEEGQNPPRSIRKGQRLREPDERLLEEVEERRAGVRAQDANELGGRGAGGPARENVVAA